MLAVAIGLVPALPRGLALAQPDRGVEAARGAETVAAAGDAADDDTRFACGKPRGTFEINLADEVTVKDLVSWAMGFSCKRFVYTQGITGRRPS